MGCEQNESLVGTYNLLIPQGADTTINLTYKVSNALVDTTGYSGKLQVRDTYGGELLLELSSDDSEILFSDTAPNIILIFPNDKTSAMTTYSGMVYDLEITSLSNVITRVIKGTFKLDREVTT